MNILGIETSCDETAVAALQITRRHLKLLSNNVSSQVALHQKWGGVVPELAARRHVEVIIPLLKKTLQESSWGWKNINAIAVTAGPGLITALQVGVETAKTLAWLSKKPLIPVNHIAGHIVSPFLQNNILPSPQTKNFWPALALVVSGGHTELYLLKNLYHKKLLGKTLDDAAGEAFDKVAKMLKLPYPGGPQISALATKGNALRFAFPRPMMNKNNYDFSFAGLKTAVLYTVTKMKKISHKDKADLSASFQQAVVDVLVYKTIKAAKNLNVKNILLSGGVAANHSLRKTLELKTKELKHVNLWLSPLPFTGDNAAMIALMGGIELLKNGPKPYLANWGKINARANWELW